MRQASERHRLKRIKERDELEEGFASNSEFLQDLDEKEHVLKVQSVILRKLAVEENNENGLSEGRENDLNAQPFIELVQEIVEALPMLKY